MEVTPTSSHATAPPPRRGVKRKASEERAAPTRYSPPPIETGVSDETLNSFALAIGRGPLVAPLMWRGIEDAAKLWAGVEEYVLFARQRGDRAPFFPATRVVKYIAHKALKQYKEAGKVDLRALKEAEQDIKRFQDALGLTWDPVQERATALVIAGAQLSWGADEAHVDGASDTGGIS
ncbi:hypothetical protein CC85DRAFT_283244 [Cutaneotrichosporon oleaginosum]|uniref:Uncharacterized protein n=1 Tax=Cutaneotrichosporon oleaginosum TaxID=879819 RepID=A0A0J0XV44_9TREE|nr:uncharacterized protein CC85DRAFT_283244 [Cutaneotrichosporon oleaginosum]KLT44931.1 hypothetical protein CC85DRAFT_283244 [Cutaneotrichosporon oleaginosum]